MSEKLYYKVLQLFNGTAGPERLVIARFASPSDRDLFLSVVRDIYDDCEYTKEDDTEGEVR